MVVSVLWWMTDVVYKDDDIVYDTFDTFGNVFLYPFKKQTGWDINIPPIYIF